MTRLFLINRNLKFTIVIFLSMLPILTLSQRNDFRGDSIHIEKITLHIIPNLVQKNITGKAKIQFSPKVNNFSTIRLDLLRMSITSLSCSLNPCTYNYNDSLIFIQFSTSLKKDSNYVLDIAYNGVPMQDGSAWGGWYWSGNYAFNLGVGFKSVPHNLGRAWFPCIDNFKVKQAFDITISCPQNLKALSNGILVSQTDSGAYSTYSYSLPQPIPAYLACINIGPYVFLNDTLKSIDNRVLLIRLAAEAKDTSNVKITFQKLKATVTHFENLFGAYPFDVVGYSLVPFNSGAMEHATNIAFPIYAADGTFAYETLWAHELAHMWWGDNITCANAEEMWINEGWASYCERLFTEHFYGRAAYHKSIDDNHRYCLQYAHLKDSGYYSLDNVPQKYTYGVHSYQKGCDMIHGLRFLDTSVFFSSCQTLQMKKRFQSITTDTLLSYFGPISKNAADLYFKSQNYISNKIESTSVEYFNASSYLYRTKILTYPIKPFTGYNLPIRINYLDSTNSNYLLTDKFVSVNGYYNYVSLSHPNYRAFFDLDNLIPDANTSQYYWINKTGTLNYDNEICNVNISQITDSALLYINRSWDITNGSSTATGIQANSRGFWTIDGLALEKLTGTIRFHYNGTAYSSVGGYESVDYGFITQPEDSLVLMFRDSYMKPWQIVLNASKTAGNLTDKKGSFLMNEIRRGQYCIGQYNYKKTAINSRVDNNSIAVFPNPASEELTLKLPAELGKVEIEILTVNGQIIFRESSLKELNFINTSQFAKGIYFIRVINETGYYYKKLIIN